MTVHPNFSKTDEKQKLIVKYDPNFIKINNKLMEIYADIFNYYKNYEYYKCSILI